MKKRILPKTLTTVTPFSKTLALILFILLPIAAFYLGMKYEEVVSLPEIIEINSVVVPHPTPTLVPGGNIYSR